MLLQKRIWYWVGSWIECTRVVIATVRIARGALTGIATVRCGAVLMTDYPDPLCGGAFI